MPKKSRARRGAASYVDTAPVPESDVDVAAMLGVALDERDAEDVPRERTPSHESGVIANVANSSRRLGQGIRETSDRMKQELSAPTYDPRKTSRQKARLVRVRRLLY